MTGNARFLQDGTDAKAGDFHPGLVDVEPTQVLRKRLAHAVVPVRAVRHRAVDLLARRVVADRVDRARVDDALDAVAACSIEHVEGADDVRAEDAVEAVLDADAAEVHDAAAALDQRIHRGGIGEIGEDDLLAGLGRSEFEDVRAAQRTVALEQVGAKVPTEPSCSAGQQQGLSVRCRAIRGECAHVFPYVCEKR